MAKKALAYLRVSGLGQVKGDGFPRQEAAVTKYAKANGLTVLETFKDEGASGTLELADRDGLGQLLDRIESNGVKIVLIEQADRLARDLMVSELILGQFRDLGVTVIAADSGTDLTVSDGDPTRTLIRQVLGAVSQFGKSILVLKLRAARDRKRRNTGRCEGQKPFGELPGEAETLDQIRLLRRKPRGGLRRSFAEIATALNEAGLRSRSGRSWNRGSVHAICKRLSW